MSPQGRYVLVALAAVVGGVTGSFRGAEAPYGTRYGSAAPAAAEPLHDAGDALVRSRAMFPLGRVTDGSAVRLLTHGELESNWLAWDPASVGSSGWPEDAPVWLVGLTGPDLTLADAAGAVGMPAPETDAAIQGMFFAWDATSGLLRTAGGLGIAGRSAANLSRLGSPAGTGR